MPGLGNYGTAVIQIAVKAADMETALHVATNAVAGALELMPINKLGDIIARTIAGGSSRVHPAFGEHPSAASFLRVYSLRGCQEMWRSAFPEHHLPCSFTLSAALLPLVAHATAHSGAAWAVQLRQAATAILGAEELARRLQQAFSSDTIIRACVSLKHYHLARRLTAEQRLVRAAMFPLQIAFIASTHAVAALAYTAAGREPHASHVTVAIERMRAYGVDGKAHADALEALFGAERVGLWGTLVAAAVAADAAPTDERETRVIARAADMAQSLGPAERSAVDEMWPYITRIHRCKCVAGFGVLVGVRLHEWFLSFWGGGPYNLLAQTLFASTFSPSLINWCNLQI
jgi:hypothetical protein